MNRLRKGDTSILVIYEMTKKLMKSNAIDDKQRRNKIDVKRGKLVVRQNLSYNRSLKVWEQTGREVKIVIEVQSEPTSYKKNDTIQVHKFPVTFLIKNFDMGFNSSFKYRSGTEAKPILLKGKQDETKRLNAINSNIRKGIDLHFFFHLMVVLKLNNLLIGRDTTNKKFPKITNPKGYVYFEKHSLFVIEQVLNPLFKKGMSVLNIGSRYSQR